MESVRTYHYVSETTAAMPPLKRRSPKLLRDRLSAAEFESPESLSADLRLASEGDHGAFERIYRALFQPVYSFVFWRVGAVRCDAEEITQDAFLAALRGGHRFEGRSSVFSWICGIAWNLVEQRRRQRRRESIRAPEGPDAWSTDGAQPVSSEVVVADERDFIIGGALSQLPPAYQAILAQRFGEGLSVPEIARFNGRSTKAMESLLHRAKTALARQLGVAGPEEDT